MTWKAAGAAVIFEPYQMVTSSSAWKKSAEFYEEKEEVEGKKLYP